MVFCGDNILWLCLDLAARLQELKKDDETIEGFGKAMKDWVSIECMYKVYICTYIYSNFLGILVVF